MGEHALGASGHRPAVNQPSIQPLSQPAIAVWEKCAQTQASSKEGGIGGRAARKPLTAHNDQFS